jgi:serine/threonine protein phosphatase 1
MKNMRSSLRPLLLFHFGPLDSTKVTMDYCISDIHGCAKTLSALLDKLALTSADTLYVLGDMIDRGPDSKGVLDILMFLSNAVCIKGNHEAMLIDAYAKPAQALDLWLMSGGRATLESFGGKVPKEYLNFLRGLPPIVELPDFYLCHADISSTGDPMETPESVLLWGGRTSKVDLELTGGRRVVSGHDRTPLEKIRSRLTSNKIMIDGGCVYRGEDGFGNLVALRLDDLELIVQENVE